MRLGRRSAPRDGCVAIPGRPARPPAHPACPAGRSPRPRSNAQTRALSHPLPVLRAREIDRWSQSQQYQELVAANLPRSTGGSGRGASAGGNPGGSGGGARFQG